jgi:hypothetical protein
MADFKTHITVASAASGVLSTCMLGAGLLGPEGVLACTAVGAAGGALPDVDSDHSTPAQLLFTLFSVLLAFLAAFSQVQRLSLVELGVVWAVAYALARYGLFRAVQKLTEHRGLFHSVLAAACSGLLSAALAHRVLGLAPVASWLGGFFVFFGYVVHLVLDELYSVDLLGRRIKRSFGTALKLISRKERGWSALLGAATVGAFLLAPEAGEFLRIFGDAQTWAAMGRKLLPHGGWFGLP